MKLRVFSLGLHSLLALMMSCGSEESMMKEAEDQRPTQMESDSKHQGIVYDVDMAEEAPANEDATSLAPVMPELAAGPAAVGVAPVIPVAPIVPVLPVIPGIPVPALPALPPPEIEFLAGLRDVPPWRANYIGTYGQLPTRVSTGGPFLYSHEVRGDW